MTRLCQIRALQICLPETAFGFRQICQEGWSRRGKRFPCRCTLQLLQVGSHEVLTLGYSNQTNELGFWWFTGKTPIPANRAYIPGDKLTAEVKGIRLLFGDDETGIKTTNLTNQTNEADAWYSIDGRKLEGKPTQKGIYIVNGKKMMVK